jgi:hypothetical protein
MKFKSIALAAVAAVALGIPAWGHHSHANYKTNEFMNLAGTITEVHWMNPHVWVYMEVDANARKSTWALEGGSIGALVRGGWTKDSMKPGDKVTVRCHHLKDESDGCLLGFVTSINGTAMDKEFD